MTTEPFLNHHPQTSDAPDVPDVPDSLVDPAYLWPLRLWILRALVRGNGLHHFVGERRFSDASVARLLGFGDAPSTGYDPAAAAATIHRKLGCLEAAPPLLPVDSTLGRNVQAIARRLALNPVERELLHFAALQQLQSELGEALDMAGELTRATACRLVAACLGHPVADVQAALDGRAKLCRSALLSLDDARPYRFTSKVDLLSGLAEALLLEHDDLMALFAASVVPSRHPRLTLDAFPHLAEDIAILRRYLNGAGVPLQQAGVNVLIHGRPGTGKTEFVRALAQAIGAELYEIPTEEPGGKPRAGRARFESYRFAQSMLAGVDRALLLFDEVEDVFVDSFRSRGEEGNVSGVKGWVNQLLEHNPVPAFWVTNQLRAIDPAYRRRFDLVLQLDVPPASVRRRILASHQGLLELDDSWLDAVAEHPGLPPAVVARAAKVSTLVCDLDPSLPAQQVLTRVMNHSLSALDLPTIQAGRADVSRIYEPDWPNADCDLQRLQDGLARVGEGRVCLYGPPGTGKTAFGRHLARVLDRPLLVKRASDILSPYVGVAERHIAEMFDEAATEQAVLLLDEADSLLRDRRGAQRSWEVTQVNEMLTQMEDFQGIFVASTNLMDSLDAAAMRRFDACIRLGYLQPDQAWEMFQWLLHVFKLVNTGEQRPEIDRLANLTPGDFAAVERHCRLDPVVNVRQLAARLRKVSEAKRDPVQKSIGFIC